MILSFPCPLLAFVVCEVIPKGQSQVLGHVVGAHLTFTSPITLKVDDEILIDPRDGHIELVLRGRIAIYRTGWLN